MRNFVLLILLFISTSLANSQSLSLFELDDTKFPVMKAKFYAFNSTGQVSPSVDELTLTENGVKREVQFVNCPPPVQAKTISLALSIDVSGSMAWNDFGEPPIKLAEVSAKELCVSVVGEASEFALQTCNDKASIVKDFTTNRLRVINSIEAVNARGKNDFSEQLLNKLTGLLNVAKRGKGKRVAVIFTDALWYELMPYHLQSCIDTCKKYNIQFYTVDHSQPLSDGYGIKTSLKTLCSETGGFYFDDVVTQSEARSVGKILQQLAQGGEACEITWQSGVSCEGLKTEIALFWQNEKAESYYFTQTKFLASLESNPPFVAFGKKKPGQNHEATIVLMARNADFIVDTIRLKTGSSNFTIPDVVFPISIPQNTGKSLTVRFSPKDSSINYALFEIETDKCTEYFSCSGGYVNKGTISTLKLKHPNGGENFVVGSSDFIQWEGVAPTDTIAVEFSNDDGKTWKVLTDKGLDLKYEWKKIPRPSSNKCRIQLKQWQKKGINTGTSEHTLVGHTDKVTYVAWNPNGNRIASASWDNTVKIWDPTTGNIVHTLIGHKQWVNHIAWSPDGKFVASASGDKTVKIWDASTGALLHTLTGHTSWVTYVSWSPDGTRVAAASGDKTANVWDAFSGLLLYTLAGHYGEVYNISWSPNGNRLATSSWDYTAIIWDALDGKFLNKLAEHGNWVTHIAWSPDGNKLATSSWDKSSIIWDVTTGATLHRLSSHSREITHVAWSPDGNYVATSSYDNTAKIWDANKGTLLHTLKGHYNEVYNVAWNRNGKRLATSGNDNTARVWDTEKGTLIRTLSGHLNSVNNVTWSKELGRLATSSNDFTSKIWFVEPDASGDELVQKDASDSLFNVVVPIAKSKDIDFRRCEVGTSKDSLIIGAVINAGNYPFRTEAMYFRGADAQSFKIVSGFPPYTIESGQGKSVELRFTPSRIGLHSVEMVIVTQSDTIIQNVYGEGVAPILSVVNSLIDFGEVPVGDYGDTNVVVIKNISSTPITINGIRQDGPNVKDFVILSGEKEFTLLPNEEKAVGLRFMPSESGRTSGALLFDYNGFGSPASIQLFGEGISKNVNAIKVIDFGKVKIGLSKDTIAVVVKNTGSLPVVFTPFKLASNVNNDFSILGNNLAFELLPNEEKSISLRFTPVFIGKVFNALVCEFAGEGSPVVIELLGEGIEPDGVTAPIEVDFGKVIVGTTKQGEALITNNGTSSITIKSTQLKDDKEKSFELLNNVVDFNLPRSGSFALKVAFTPTGIGKFTNEVEVSHSGFDSPRRIRLVGEGITLEDITAPEEINFGKVKVGTTEWKRTYATNTSNREITLDSLVLRNNISTPYAVPNNFNNLLLFPYDSALFNVYFSPTSKGVVTNEIIISHNGRNSPKIIRLIGEGIEDIFIPDTVRTTIALSNSVAKAGESSALYLYIKEKQKLDLVNAPKQFVADITLNNTVMFINDAAFPCVTNDKSTCRIRLEGTRGNSDTLEQIPFITTLGNTDNAVVELTNFFWKDTVIRTEVIKENGSIRLSGVCEEGGVRLYVPNGNTMSLASRPNPVHDKVRIEYGLAETTSVVLEIIDINGQVIATPITSNVSAGAYAIDYDASTLGNGIYILRMRTPNDVLTSRIEVVH